MAGLLPRLVSAGPGGSRSDSGDSGSNESSTPGLGQSAEGSAESSAATQSPSASADNTQHSADGSGLSTEGTQDSNASDTALLLGTTSTVGAVLLILVLAGTDDTQEPTYSDPPRSPAARLLDSGFVNARRDLGLILQQLCTSPAALDRMAAEALLGSGPALEALARAARLPRARVAQAVQRFWLPAPSTRDATRIALQILGDLAPELAPDPALVAETLSALRREQQRGHPAAQPAHQQLASWMGVSAEDYAPVLRAALQELPSRARLHAHPQPWADALADALATAFPAQIAGRLEGMARRVDQLKRAYGLGWPEASWG